MTQIIRIEDEEAKRLAAQHLRANAKLSSADANEGATKIRKRAASL